MLGGPRLVIELCRVVDLVVVARQFADLGGFAAVGQLQLVGDDDLLTATQALDAIEIQVDIGQGVTASSWEIEREQIAVSVQVGDLANDRRAIGVIDGQRRAVGHITDRGRRRPGVGDLGCEQLDDRAVHDGQRVFDLLAEFDIRVRVARIGFLRGLGEHIVGEGQHGRTHVQIRIAGTRDRGILAPSTRDQRAVLGIDGHPALVIVRVVEEAIGLQRADRVGIGRGAAHARARDQITRRILDLEFADIGDVIDIERGIAHRGHPDRTAVGRTCHRIVVVARTPGDDELVGQVALGDERVTPVVRRVAGGIGIDHADREELGAGGRVEMRCRRRHQDMARAVGIDRDRKSGLGRGIVLDGDRAAARVVEDHIGRVGRQRGADRRIVAAGPLLVRRQREPAVFVSGADVARDQIDAYALVSGDFRPGVESAIDKVGLTFVERDRGDVGRRGGIAVPVDGDGRPVLGRDDMRRGVLEQLVGAGGHGFDVLADRQGIALAGIGRIDHRDRAREHRARRGGPARLGDRYRLGRADLVAAVVIDAVGRGRIDRVAQQDGLAGIEQVICRSRCGAVGGIAVAPDLRGGLDRVVDVGFIAVFPMVIDHDCPVAGRADRDHGLDVARHAARYRLQRSLDIGFGQRHIGGLRNAVGSRSFDLDLAAIKRQRELIVFTDHAREIRVAVQDQRGKGMALVAEAVGGTVEREVDRVADLFEQDCLQGLGRSIGRIVRVEVDRWPAIAGAGAESSQHALQFSRRSELDLDRFAARLNRRDQLIKSLLPSHRGRAGLSTGEQLERLVSGLLRLEKLDDQALGLRLGAGERRRLGALRRSKAQHATGIGMIRHGDGVRHRRPIEHEPLLQRHRPETAEPQSSRSRRRPLFAGRTCQYRAGLKVGLAAFAASAALAALALAAHDFGGGDIGAGDLVPDAAVDRVHRGTLGKVDEVAQVAALAEEVEGGGVAEFSGRLAASP